MFVAKVTGSVVATQKTASMVGHKLLIVEPYRIDAKDRSRLTTTGRTFVAVDTVGAGEGEYVLIVQGSERPLDPGDQDSAGRCHDYRHRRQRASRPQVRLRSEPELTRIRNTAAFITHHFSLRPLLHYASH